MSISKKEIASDLARQGHIADSKYFFFDTEPRSRKRLAIVFGGFEKCAPDFEIKRTTYPYYVLEIPLRGKCHLEIDGSEYLLKKGSLGSFTPGVPHNYLCDPDNPMEHIFIVFTGSEAKGLLEQSGLGAGSVIPMARPGESQYLAEAILKKGMEKTEYSQQLCCGYLRVLLLEQAADIVNSGSSVSGSLETFRECRKYIDDHFSSISSPSQVADVCGINVRYISRLFKRFGDVTPHEYIMRLKLNKAASILLTSSLPISKVTQIVGFEDQFHFSRNFKKFHGLSPRQYRDAHMEKPLSSQ